MAKRAHGEGSLFQRKDGRWQASLQVRGVRRTVYAQSRAAALAKLAELRRQAGVGLADPGRRTVGDLLDEWLRAVGPTLKPRTLSDYRYTCDTYIRPALGGVRPSQLAPLHLQRFCGDLVRRGLGRTARKCHALLHRALRFAVLWGWLSENPADRVLPPAHRAQRKTIWSRAELDRFLEATRSHKLYALWLLLISTGMRLGEALALQWEDVDLAAAVIRVNRALSWVGGEALVHPPKTAAGTRAVAVPPEVIAALRRHAGQQVLAGMAGRLVFCRRDGGPLRHNVVERALREACRDACVPEVTPHTLRHLHASLLLDAGLPVPVVSARLGHTTAAVTMAVYAHALKGGEDPAAAVLASVLQATTGGAGPAGFVA
jgi:integrase